MGRMGTQGGMVGRREPPAKGWERQGVERVPRAQQGWLAGPTGSATSQPPAS